MNIRSLFALCLLGGSLIGCVPGLSGRIDALSSAGGIGGTGMEFWRGGIGGTGIIGTVTGFGSVVVNGMHIAYDPKMPLDSVISGQTAEDLRVGQQVAIEASRVDGRLTARAIALRYRLAGPIESISPHASLVRIMGRSVHISPQTHFAAGVKTPDGGVAGLRVGQNIMVSGLRHGAVLEAGFIAPAPRADFVLLTGVVSAHGGRTVVVAGQKIVLDAGRRPHVRNGNMVRIVGRLTDGTVHAKNVRVFPAKPFSGRVSRLSVEGFISKARGGKRLDMDGVSVDLDALSGGGVTGERHMILFGLVDRRDGVFRALRGFDAKAFDADRGAPTPQAAARERREERKAKALRGGPGGWGVGRGGHGASSGGASSGGGHGGSGGHSREIP